MRVSNGQLAELDDILEAKGLDLSLFERVRNDNDGGIKFKNDYYQYVIRKTNWDVYVSFILGVGNRENYEYEATWETTKQSFDSWAKDIKSEVESDKRLNLRLDSVKLKPFPPMVIRFSPKFDEIYNQAYQAESIGLDELCGLGYRKSFEFLIKDYIMRGKPKDEKRAIKEMEIMPCIRKYVQDDRVRALAERVLWLGNDHAHYLKKWQNKSLDDLKKLIDTTIEWIDNDNHYSRLL